MWPRMRAIEAAIVERLGGEASQRGAS